MYKLPNMTHCNLLHHICIDKPVNDQLYKRFINFIKQLYQSENALSKLCYKLAVNGSGSSLSNSMNVISSHYNIPKNTLTLYKQCILHNIPSSENIVNANIIRDMVSMRDGVYNNVEGEKPVFTCDEIEFVIQFLCTI